MDNRNFWLGLSSILLGLVVLIPSSRLAPMPALFPKVVSALMILLGACAAGTWGLQRIRGSGSGSGVGLFPEASRGNGKRELRVLPPLFIAVLYVFLFKPVGFALLTPPLIGLTAWYLGYRKVLILIAVSVGVTALLYLLFAYLLSVPLPRSPVLGF
jgi:putative tricarboxylic transport membrane protein